MEQTNNYGNHNPSPVDLNVAATAGTRRATGEIAAAPPQAQQGTFYGVHSDRAEAVALPAPTTTTSFTQPQFTPDAASPQFLAHYGPRPGAAQLLQTGILSTEQPRREDVERAPSPPADEPTASLSTTSVVAVVSGAAEELGDAVSANGGDGATSGTVDTEPARGSAVFDPENVVVGTAVDDDPFRMRL